MRATLHPYQEYSKNFILTRPRSALFMECGTGKTLVTLSALETLQPNHHILVIAPKLVAQTSWTEEIIKWSINLNPVVLAGLSKKKRLQMYEQIPHLPPSIFFINRELVVDLIENTPDWYFPTVVIDEMHSFKSATSSRFKALKKISPKIERLIGLTGTPQPNGLLDLWAQVYLLDHGYRLGQTMTQYKEWFFIPDTKRLVNNRVVFFDPKPGAEEEIHRRLRGLVVSVKNTALKLPPISYVDHRLTLDKSEKDLYNKFIKENVLAFDETERNVPVDDDKATSFIPATNAGVKALKLWQMASGALYKPPEERTSSHDFYHIHSKKAEFLEHILETSDGNVLVFYNFKSDLVILEKELQHLGYVPYGQPNKKKHPTYAVFDKSVELKNAWCDRKINVLLMQPDSAGIGINIQSGGHTIVWYTIPVRLDTYTQANARLFRQGQTESVIVHHLLTKGTIDEKFRNNLDIKERSQQALLEATKQVLSTPYL